MNSTPTQPPKNTGGKVPDPKPGDPKGPGIPVLPIEDEIVKEVWGHLPDKMRQQATQYYQQDFMPRYTELLKLYYSSLAEKGGKRDVGPCIPLWTHARGIDVFVLQPPQLPSRGRCGAAAGVLGLAGHAQQPAAPPVAPAPTKSRSGAEFINQETQTQIERGLELLARSPVQRRLFPGGSITDRGGTGGWSVGVTSLAGLAMMAGGHQPGRGKYGKHVAKAVEYVASMADGPTPGFLTTAESQTVGRLASYPSPIYSHGFGTLFLAEVCGMHPAAAKDAKVRGALEQAVEFTVKAQNQEGGWRYEPNAQYADVSVTVAQMMALRAARNAGLFVRKTVMDNAATYVKACQMPDGGFSYFKGQGYSAFARSAAAIVGLYSAGIYERQGGRARLALPAAIHPGPAVLAARNPAATLLVRAVLCGPGHVDRGRRLLDHLAPGHPRRTPRQGEGGRRRLDRRQPRLGLRDRHGPHHSAIAQQLPADPAEVALILG